MSKYINPFTDVGFKLIFGQEISKDLLIDFLNNLLEGERHITDLTFLDKEQVPDTNGDRGVIYDIYCETDNKEHIIVEMQNKYQPFFKDRAIYYMSHAISRQGIRGEAWNYRINAVYGVFFMNFKLGNELKDFRTDVGLVDMKTHSPFSDKMRLIFLELPSFTKEEDECENDFERWIYVLKNMQALDRIPFAARKAVLERLGQIAEVSGLPQKLRDQYDESLKVYRDNLAVLEGAKIEGRTEGRAEGRAEGREEGRAEGREEGRAEGRAEGEKNMAKTMALKMKRAGMDIQQISQFTGLSKEEINAIE